MGKQLPVFLQTMDVYVNHGKKQIKVPPKKLQNPPNFS